MKTILLLVVLATRTVFGQVENLRGLDLIDRMLLEKALNDAALNGARKANRELLEQIDGLTFRVEVDATGRPLHLPSEFYTFRAGDPTKYTGDLRKHFAHEILPAQKAKAYQAAWDNYNAAIQKQPQVTQEQDRAALQIEAKAQAILAAQAAQDAAAQKAAKQVVPPPQPLDPQEKLMEKALQESRVAARRLYPSIRVKDSALAKKWTEIYEALPPNDPLHSDPDAPLKITIRAANQLGILPSESSIR